MDPATAPTGRFGPAAPAAASTDKKGYLIVFRGLGGALDEKSASKIANAQGREIKVFDYTQTKEAAEFVKAHPGVDHSLLGFSAGANNRTLTSYSAALKSAGVSQPSSITTVGAADAAKLYNPPGIPTVHYLDHSGQGHSGEPNTVNLGAGTSHLDPNSGGMAQVAARTPAVNKPAAALAAAPGQQGASGGIRPGAKLAPSGQAPTAFVDAKLSHDHT